MAKRRRYKKESSRVNGQALDAALHRKTTWPGQLAKNAGVSESLILKMLDGKERCLIEKIEAVATALGMAAGDLMIADSDPARPALALPVEPPSLPENNSFDWFIHLYERITDFCNDWFPDFSIREGVRCRSEEDVRLAVRMIMAGTGMHLVDSNTDITDDEAAGLKEIITSMSTDGYFERVIETWRAIPDSLAFAVSDNRRVGSLRILPITETAYEAIRSGKLSVDYCDMNNFVYPSNFLFWDALGELPAREYPFTERRTRQSVRVMFLMFAWLSYGIAKPLRILSLGGTPELRRRAESLAIEPLGVRMPGSDLMVFEMNMRKASLVPVIVREVQRRLFESEGTA
jgi:hypothetical protein